MITSGYQDTRVNNEDFAITPYIFSVVPNKGNKYKTYGFGLCWGWFAIFIAYSFKVPKGYKFFQWFGNTTKRLTK